MAFFWRLPAPLESPRDDLLVSEETLTVPTDGVSDALRNDETVCIGAHCVGNNYWRLPLPSFDFGDDLALGEEETNAENVGNSCREPHFDFWRLPLPPLDDEEEEIARNTNAIDPLHMVMMEGGHEPCNDVNTDNLPADVSARREDVTGGARQGNSDDGSNHYQEEERSIDAQNHAIEPATETADNTKAKQPRSLAGEMQAMLNRYVKEYSVFENNIRELEEMQERLRKLTVQAASGGFEVGASAASVEGEGMASRVALVGASSWPSEVTGRMMWHLDVASLGRSISTCQEWCRLGLSSERWHHLCVVDWGMSSNGTYHEYRQQMERWKILWTTLEGLKGTNGICGTFGSLSRRRLFEALGTLAELGAAESCSARYPAQIQALVREARATKTLLALLEDESPYLLCLAVRCLADLAVDENTRRDVREVVISRGALIRTLLEGDDADLVEAGARMMLNLHRGAPGTPIVTRKQGPWDFMQADGQVDLANHLLKGNAALASPWTGAWVGEMRYARGGERHSALRLLLGPKGDPAIERARAIFRALELERLEQRDNGVDLNNRTSDVPRLRSEGQAEYWHYFGFLADSDFESVAESVQYVNEHMDRRRRSPHSPTKAASLGNVQVLIGAGWDEQNGAFTVEAPLPQPPAVAQTPNQGSPTSSPSQSPTSAVTAKSSRKNVVPLKLQLRYETRGSTSELTGFLAVATGCTNAVEVQQPELFSTDLSMDAAGFGTCGPEETSGASSTDESSRALYGVWATAPSLHKHLFALRRVGPLPDCGYESWLPEEGVPPNGVLAAS